VTGSGPHEKVITPPLATAATNASLVQLSFVPLPTTVRGLETFASTPSVGIAHWPLGLPAGGPSPSGGNEASVVGPPLVLPVPLLEAAPPLAPTWPLAPSLVAVSPLHAAALAAKTNARTKVMESERWIFIGVLQDRRFGRSRTLNFVARCEAHIALRAFNNRHAPVI
jgi:hypothetical protein